MRRTLTRTMDLLLGFCIAGQNPTRVKVLRNSVLCQESEGGVTPPLGAEGPSADTNKSHSE